MSSDPAPASEEPTQPASHDPFEAWAQGRAPRRTTRKARPTASELKLTTSSAPSRGHKDAALAVLALTLAIGAVAGLFGWRRAHRAPPPAPPRPAVEPAPVSTSSETAEVTSSESPTDESPLPDPALTPPPTPTKDRPEKESRSTTGSSR